MLFTALGVGVAYAILPVAAQFLLSFAIPGVIEPLITADAYFGLVTTMFVTFGLVMQFPFVILLLARVGIIDAQRLRRSRRYVLLGHVRLCRRDHPQRRSVQPNGNDGRRLSAVRVHDLDGRALRAVQSGCGCLT